MIGSVRHLHEDRLFESYVAARSGEAVDERVAAHLAGCGGCRARYRDLEQFMDDLREQAETETDAIFTPQQLHAQQQQILRRLEHVGQPARIISFPARLMRRRLAAATRHAGPRWAAAAVAGLLVGVGVGVFLDSDAGSPSLSITATPTSTRETSIVASGAAASAAAPLVDDDEFLRELEAALGTPLNNVLLPFDALTPRVQEISSRPIQY